MVAIGSHEPGARDVHDALVGRATVVVESSSSALCEAPASLLLAEIGPWPCHVNAIPRCTYPVTGYRFRAIEKRSVSLTTGEIRVLLPHESDTFAC